MKSKQSWQFSCEPSDLDIARIVHEAGKDARVVRFTVGTDTYTAINQEWLEATGNYVDWEKDEPNYIGAKLPKPYMENGELMIPAYGTYRKWAITEGDFVGVFLDRVKVKVEVF